MKSKSSSGSALLLVFTVSFILSLAALRCWRISSMMVDIQYQRELFYKNFYLSQRVFNSGIDLTCKKFNNFLKLKKSVSVDVNFCLTDVEIKNGNFAHVTVSTLAKNTNCLLISASLSQKNEIVCNMRCLLERKISEKNKETKEQRIYFVVNNFTLSTSL